MSETESTFCETLPLQPRIWDPTRLATAMKCWRLHLYSTVRGYRGEGSVHTDFGSLYHGAVERLDLALLAGREREAAILEVFRWLLEQTWTEAGPWGGRIETVEGPCPKGHKSARCKCVKPQVTAYVPADPKKNRVSLLRAFLVYADAPEAVELFAFPQESGEPIPAVELQTRVPLPLTSPDGSPYELLVNIDSMALWEGDLAVRERKTTGRNIMQARYWEQFNPNPQIDSYELVSHLVHTSDEHGSPRVLVEAMELGAGYARLRRMPIRVPAARREEWFRELQEVIKEAEQRAVTAWRYGVPEEEAFPRRTTSCINAWGACPFLEVCRASPLQRDGLLEAGFRIERWNPLKAESESEEN